MEEIHNCKKKGIYAIVGEKSVPLSYDRSSSYTRLGQEIAEVRYTGGIKSSVVASEKNFSKLEEKGLTYVVGIRRNDSHLDYSCLRERDNSGDIGKGGCSPTTLRFTGTTG